MIFKDDKPIYRQIIDYCFNCILSGEWQTALRIPSVREMAVELAVNSHTVMKAYEYLQIHGIISPRRGMGFFLEENAKESVNTARRDEFFETTLPELFSEMKILGIGIDEITTRWHKT